MRVAVRIAERDRRLARQFLDPLDATLELRALLVEGQPREDPVIARVIAEGHTCVRHLPNHRGRQVELAGDLRLVSDGRAEQFPQQRVGNLERQGVVEQLLDATDRCAVIAIETVVRRLRRESRANERKRRVDFFPEPLAKPGKQQLHFLDVQHAGGRRVTSGRNEEDASMPARRELREHRPVMINQPIVEGEQRRRTVERSISGQGR